VRERLCRRAAEALVHELLLGGGHPRVRRVARRAADVVVGVVDVVVRRYVRRKVRRDAWHRTRRRRQVDAVGWRGRVDVVELRPPLVGRLVAQCTRAGVARVRVDVVELRAPSVERRVA
jgi:phosphoribulokinase